MRRFILYWLPLGVYTALIFILSVIPSGDEMPDIWQIDKVFHLGAYSILGLLLARVLTVSGVLMVVVVATSLAFSFGFVIEVYQYFLATRDFSYLDAVANGVGAFIGAYTWGGLFHKRG